jgi:hypothetical protein
MISFDYFLDVNPASTFSLIVALCCRSCSPPQGPLLADGLSPPFELGALHSV